MKRIVMFLVGLLLLTTCVVFTSCKDSVPYGLTLTEESVDSIVHSQVVQLVNPMFTSIDEVLVYRDLDNEGKHIDSIFNNLPTPILKNVTTVCINKDRKTSKRAIISEYLANKSVYDNLSSSDSKVVFSALEEPRVTKDVDSVPATEVKYSQHDTTISGKQYKAHIKQETSYESK